MLIYRYSRDEVLGEVLYPCGDNQFDTLEKQVCLTLDIAHKGLLVSNVTTRTFEV